MPSQHQATPVPSIPQLQRNPTTESPGIQSDIRPKHHDDTYSTKIDLLSLRHLRRRSGLWLVRHVGTLRLSASSVSFFAALRAGTSLTHLTEHRSSPALVVPIRSVRRVFVWVACSRLRWRLNRSLYSIKRYRSSRYNLSIVLLVVEIAYWKGQ